MMAKLKNSAVTRGITDRATNTFPVVVVQSAFPLLSRGGYLLLLTSLN